jgi:hypothetical protein
MKLLRKWSSMKSNIFQAQRAFMLIACKAYDKAYREPCAVQGFQVHAKSDHFEGRSRSTLPMP